MSQNGSIFTRIQKMLGVSVILLCAFLYLIYLFILLLYDAKLSPNLLNLLLYLNRWEIHAAGILILIFVALRIFHSAQSRKRALKKIKLIFSEYDENQFKEIHGSELLDETEIQKSLIDFSQDARELLIFAGDGDFLFTGNGKPSEQFIEIKRFGVKCKILLNKQHLIEPSLLMELHNAGVQIKIYPQSKQNYGLRGRIKITDTGNSAKLFTKEEDNYLSQEIKNNYVLEMLKNEYNDIFKSGRNPFIKYIIFDLAGVFFDGDFETFLRNINSTYDLQLENINLNYLCVDEKLNLKNSKYTIIDYIQSNTIKPLTKEEKRHIKDLWNSTWFPNQHMQNLANTLKTNEYVVAISSNCDEDNGEKYLQRNYFNGFERFLSYELNILKPNEKYFEYILDHFRCEPYQCLLLDDHEKNIEKAKQMGFNTIKIARNPNGEERARTIWKELANLSIQLEM